VKPALVIQPSAENDLKEAKGWYEQILPGLGETFLDRVDETLSRVQQHPHAYHRIFEELRVAMVKRFPYMVIYRIDAIQITVFAVYHTSRDPSEWRTRV
jgi:plasmid stabilization system protein ParE